MSEHHEVEILLVDDNEDDIDMTLHALRQVKLANHIHIARDGVEALEFLFGTGAHAGRNIESAPKVILLDLKLPKVDGFQVLQRVKGDLRTKTIPVVILTSSREHRDVMESYDRGVNSYIVKPVEFKSFATTVRELGRYWLLLNQARK